MAKKYHVGKNGPAECKASKRACRYGGSNTHFNTFKEAEDAFKQANNLSSVSTLKKSTVQPTPQVKPPTPQANTYDNYIMMQKVDVRNNNNKFYELKVKGNDLVARWGRVGNAGVKKVYAGQASRFYDQARAKEKKGYKKVNVLQNTKPLSQKGGLREAALEGLLQGRNIPEIRNMVNHLVDNNIHQIGEFSGGKLRVVNGNVSGPLGLVTQQNLDEAQALLHKINNLQQHRSFSNFHEQIVYEDKLNTLKEQYMMLVPQNIGMNRAVMKNFLTTKMGINRQQDFINQLQAQIKLAEQLKDDPTSKKKHDFRYSIDLVTDQKEIKRLQDKFQKTGNSMHGSLNNVKIKNVYALTDNKGDSFKHARENIRNVQELWHGSRSYNILSILNNGLVTPDNLATAKTAGAMFGNGLYFSNQSTKSAQYSRGGRYSSGTDNKFYMIVADVAMGYEYRPDRSGHKGSTYYDQRLKGHVPDARGKKYNSINVKSGHGGVINHEAIVPSADQVNIKYILELES